MGKKHHQSIRKHRSRDRSSHHTSQTSTNFTIPDHPSGIPPPLPSPLLPPLPTETSSFNFPLPPSTPPKPPRPVIVRQHGLYTYHNGTPQYQPRKQVRDDSENFSEKAWPGPLPPPAQQKEKKVVRGTSYDLEKGAWDVETEAADGEVLQGSTPPSTKRRRLKCILVLTLMVVLFLVAPIVIGIGISTAKKHGKSGSNVNEVSSNIRIDERVPTIPTPSGSNGLSYGDWFCSGCRCVKDQDALAKCLETNTRR